MFYKFGSIAAPYRRPPTEAVLARRHDHDGPRPADGRDDDAASEAQTPTGPARRSPVVRSRW
jgi:hypothetical protein